MSKWTDKIPSILWIPIIIGIIALVIGGILALFYGIGYVEALGSSIVLVFGWIGFRIGNNSDSINGGLSVAIGIIIFAVMGIALDQIGNFVYNQPMEWIFCSDNSELVRKTVQQSGGRGGISLTQDFRCIAENGDLVRKINMLEHLSFRFLQYILIGYILLGLSRLYTKLKGRFSSS